MEGRFKAGRRTGSRVASRPGGFIPPLLRESCIAARVRSRFRTDPAAMTTLVSASFLFLSCRAAFPRNSRAQRSSPTIRALPLPQALSEPVRRLGVRSSPERKRQSSSERTAPVIGRIAARRNALALRCGSPPDAVHMVPQCNTASRGPTPAVRQEPLPFPTLRPTCDARSGKCSYSGLALCSARKRFRTAELRTRTSRRRSLDGKTK